jgi:hypothetical protein
MDAATVAIGLAKDMFQVASSIGPDASWIVSASRDVNSSDSSDAHHYPWVGVVAVPCRKWRTVARFRPAHGTRSSETRSDVQLHARRTAFLCFPRRVYKRHLADCTLIYARFRITRPLAGRPSPRKQSVPASPQIAL